MSTNKIKLCKCIFSVSAKINILKYTKYELSAKGEKFIGFSDVTTVTADSDSVTDTVDTDCLTVAAMNSSVP